VWSTYVCSMLIDVGDGKEGTRMTIAVERGRYERGWGNEGASMRSEVSLMESGLVFDGELLGNSDEGDEGRSAMYESAIPRSLEGDRQTGVWMEGKRV